MGYEARKICPKRTPLPVASAMPESAPTGRRCDAQLEQLCKEGCNPIYREKASGAQPSRRELLRMLKALGSGDVVTVKRIDRLARSNFDLFAIVKWTPGPSRAPIKRLSF